MNDFVTAYQLAPASATTILGSHANTDAACQGDILEHVCIIPGSTSPGSVSIQDAAGAAIQIFAGGATSVADLKPIWLKLSIRTKVGAWSIICGANVTVLATGWFK